MSRPIKLIALSNLLFTVAFLGTRLAKALYVNHANLTALVFALSVAIITIVIQEMNK